MKKIALLLILALTLCCAGFASAENGQHFNYIVLEDGTAAFSWCTKLENITIPEGVTALEYQLFYACRSLSSVSLPDSLTTIDDHAFGGCTGLAEISIPKSVTTISSKAFSECKNITIRAPKKSYAADYAKANGIAFKKN